MLSANAPPLPPPKPVAESRPVVVVPLPAPPRSKPPAPPRLPTRPGRTSDGPDLAVACRPRRAQTLDVRAEILGEIADLHGSRSLLAPAERAVCGDDGFRTKLRCESRVDQGMEAARLKAEVAFEMFEILGAEFRERKDAIDGILLGVDGKCYSKIEKLALRVSSGFAVTCGSCGSRSRSLDRVA